jgi:hypothetical protein
VTYAAVTVNEVQFEIELLGAGARSCAVISTVRRLVCKYLEV